MAGVFNKVLLMGRVTGDPESRQLQNCTVVNFRLAVGRSKKNPQTGQYEPDPNTLFIDCSCFDYPDAKRKTGNVVMQYVKKGDPIFIEGRLQFEQWDDKTSGQKRSKHKVAVDDIQLLGNGKSENEGGAPASGQRQAAGGYQAPVDVPNEFETDSSGNIPF